MRGPALAAAVVVAASLAGCGGSSSPAHAPASSTAAAASPAVSLLLSTAAAHYSASGDPKVTKARCNTGIPGKYDCTLDYAFTRNGTRSELETTVPVQCHASTCHAIWGRSPPGHTIEVISHASASGTASTSSSTDSPQLALTCLHADTDDLKLLTEIGKVQSISSLDSPIWGQLVDRADTEKTDLEQIGDSGTPTEEAELGQYESALTHFSTAARDAASGNASAVTGDLAGVGQEIGRIPKVTGSICKAHGA